VERLRFFKRSQSTVYHYDEKANARAKAESELKLQARSRDADSTLTHRPCAPYSGARAQYASAAGQRAK
jgi:hypothetical protein